VSQRRLWVVIDEFTGRDESQRDLLGHATSEWPQLLADLAVEATRVEVLGKGRSDGFAWLTRRVPRIELGSLVAPAVAEADPLLESSVITPLVAPAVASFVTVTVAVRSPLALIGAAGLPVAVVGPVPQTRTPAIARRWPVAVLPPVAVVAAARITVAVPRRPVAVPSGPVPVAEPAPVPSGTVPVPESAPVPSGLIAGAPAGSRPPRVPVSSSTRAVVE
jgi:hypothetical protein